MTRRRRALADHPWTWLRQVHGATVVVVDQPGHQAGARADAGVTPVPGAVLAVHTADCAPVVMVSPEGMVGAAHAGWRGLAAGVIEATVDAMAALGATRVDAYLGPCIRAECYEFGAVELTTLVDRLGSRVAARTAAGRPALDVAGAVAAALDRAGATLAGDEGSCTACGGGHWSYRARGDRQRQAGLVWVEPA